MSSRMTTDQGTAMRRSDAAVVLRQPETSRTLRGTLVGIAAAFVATAAVYAIGNLGAPIRVVTGWSPDGADLTLAEVSITAVSAVALGGLLLWWMERRWTRSFTAWGGIGGDVAGGFPAPLLRPGRPPGGEGAP